MNKKIINYVVACLVLVLIILSGYLLIHGNGKEKEKILVCKYTEDKDVLATTYLREATIDSTGKVLKIKSSVTNKYKNKEDYDNAKKAATNKDTKYDDSKKQTTQVTEESKITDSTGKEVKLWYVDYQDILESTTSYKCKLK